MEAWWPDVVVETSDTATLLPPYLSMIFVSPFQAMRRE